MAEIVESHAQRALRFREALYVETSLLLKAVAANTGCVFPGDDLPSQLRAFRVGIETGVWSVNQIHEAVPYFDPPMPVKAPSHQMKRRRKRDSAA